MSLLDITLTFGPCSLLQPVYCLMVLLLLHSFNYNPQLKAVDKKNMVIARLAINEANAKLKRADSY